jgi:hypothetical protein
MKSKILRMFGCAMLVLSVPLEAVSENYAKEVEFPLGDAVSGREAFVKFQCYVCHGVAHDVSLPEPLASTETMGPLLQAQTLRPPSLIREQMQGFREMAGLPQPDYTPEYYAVAIMSPSHSIAPGFGHGSAEDIPVSPMMDHSDEMTVRELKDIVAYLTQQKAE